MLKLGTFEFILCYNETKKQKRGTFKMQKRVNSSTFANTIRKLYWKILLKHLQYLEQTSITDIGSNETQKFQQEQIAISNFMVAIPGLIIDPYRLDDAAYDGQKELPKLDEFEINNTQFVDQEKMLNILRNLYWQALVAKNSYQFEINSDNPNYDYRLGGYRLIFDAYDWSDKYQDIDELIKDLHFVLDLDDQGANKYVQVNENGQPVKNPAQIKRITF